MTRHLTFAGLFPHPPIMVPSVAGPRHGQCQRSFDGGRRFAERLVASDPRRVVVLSPHAPRRDRAFGLWQGDRLYGDLGRFGAPQDAVDVPGDGALLERLQADGEIPTWGIPSDGMDHGAVIPLWFLQQAGWQGPTSVLSLPWRYDNAQLAACGRWLARLLEALGEPYALVASGDMTHRALPNAPAGYHPQAVEFDKALCRCIQRGRLDTIADIDPDLRQLAAEDAADTSLIVAAACNYEARSCEVMSYEHPFGVGYLVAVFYDGGRTAGSPPSAPSSPS